MQKKKTKTKKRIEGEKRQSRRMQKKGCWYSLYKCKLDRHFLRCARYFNLVCKNDTATNKKAERATTPVPPSPFVLLAQPSSSSSSWPSGLDPTPTPTAALAHLWRWPFSHFGCGDFQVKNAATSKGFDWGAPGVGMEIFQLSNFYAKMSSG